MATFEIKGSTFELPDSLQGDALKSTLEKLSGMGSPSQPPSNLDSAQNVQKFLGFLSKAEGADYTTVVGGGQFNDFSKHPNIAAVRTKDGISTAAGRYQITKTTYDDVAPKIGIVDFSPASQDKIALELIKRKGALADIESGNFGAAVGKLGGVWASLPSSPYKQNKRSKEWADAELTKLGSKSFVDTPQPNPQAVAKETQGATPFARIRTNVDPATLNDDYDWIMGAKQLYEFTERKPWEGNTSDLAEWGKRRLGFFHNNLTAMSYQAQQIITKGTQKDKEAFNYMMETLDPGNTQWSLEGAGRWAEGFVKDPANLVGVGTLGLGFLAKGGAQFASKLAIKEALKQAIGRTAIPAAMEGAIFNAVDDSIKQGVRVDAGVQDQFSMSQLAGAAGTGALVGFGLGAAGDLAAQKIVGLVQKGLRKENPTSTIAPERTIPVESKLTPSEEPKVSPMSTEVTSRASEPNLTLDAPNTSKIEGVDLTTARDQAGRKAEDNIIPSFDEAPPKIDIPEINTGMRTTRLADEPTAEINWKKLDELAAPAVKQMSEFDNKTLANAINGLRMTRFSPEEYRVAARAVQRVAEGVRKDLTDAINRKVELENLPNINPKQAEEIQQLNSRINSLEERMRDSRMNDEAYGTFGGTVLSDRGDTPQPGLAKVSIESLMEENGISRADAEILFAKSVEDSMKSAENTRISKEYDDQFWQAWKEGDYSKAGRIGALKQRHLESTVDAKVDGAKQYMEKANEIAISNVFTPTTVQVNFFSAAVKTIITPGLKFLLSNPLERATRIEAAAAYTAMAKSSRASWDAALTALKYEQAILTRGNTRLLENEMAVKGIKGGILRFYPRILNASDEFLSQVNYRSYIAGREAAKASVEGAEKGLKGKDLDQYIKDAASKAIDDALVPAQSDELLRPIINKGVNLKYSGEKLANYVEREATLNPAEYSKIEALISRRNPIESLRQGTDEEALDYARDVLYKRRFSGSGTASEVAKMYESAVKKFPVMRLMGQLFFRTPVRVFEEGVRLTPGIQILAPNFMNDLAGKNGMLRQVRAQAESMMGLAISGFALSMLGQGRMTGAGAYDDYKQEKARGDTDKAPQYSIRMSDGSYFVYRNLDPIATPLKIIANAMENYDKLHIRQAQGEVVLQSSFDKVYAHLSIGTMALTRAFRDANLTAGIDATIKLFQDAADPENSEDKILKFLGEKLALLVPNTAQKIARDNDPTIKDPRTFWQVVESKFNVVGLDIEGVQSSYAYDALGNQRRIADTGALWNMFSTATSEELARGRSEKELYVLRELDNLSMLTGSRFGLPFQREDVGNVDLRTILSSDGKLTIYDKWQENFRKLPVENALAPILQSPAPVGNRNDVGMKVDLVRTQLKKLQNDAFLLTMSQERKTIENYKQRILDKLRNKSGLNDF